MIEFISSLNFWNTGATSSFKQKGWVYKPGGSSVGKPCLIWFAGRGEGADIARIAKSSTVPADITRGWAPGFTVFAFTGNGSGAYGPIPGQANADYYGRILAYVLNDLGADPSRIYLAGLSGGGDAIFQWLTTSQQLCEAVAAVLPASPMQGTWEQRLVEFAAWAGIVRCWGAGGSGTGDASFLARQKRVNAVIEQAGGVARVTEYAGAGHSGAVWEPFYAPTSDRWPWLLQWSRGRQESPTEVSLYSLRVMSDGRLVYERVEGKEIDLSKLPTRLQ